MAASAPFLQVEQSPRQGDAAVERLLPVRMTQPDHESHLAPPSKRQATPEVPAVSIAPGAQPQKRRGRPPKKVRGTKKTVAQHGGTQCVFH